MSFRKTTPILRIFDEAKAKDFYLAFLGFKLDYMSINAPFGNRLTFTSAFST
jgi:catechol 2,3-dioxygenase-like lactoylglutathione lyase family enzyme